MQQQIVDDWKKYTKELIIGGCIEFCCSVDIYNVYEDSLHHLYQGQGNRHTVLLSIYQANGIVEHIDNKHNPNIVFWDIEALPFRHLYTEQDEVAICEFIRQLIKLHSTLDDNYSHHFGGLFSRIPMNLMKSNAMLLHFVGLAHPKLFRTIMKEGFTVNGLTKNKLETIVQLMRSEGKVSPKYLVHWQHLAWRMA
jgi:hypothetical protein